ncbi:uncharacterized protein B0H18DRAFT_1107713 [Fomitopsis serialis]|uniref:uncharacterized protein n=1 Tax=Fomitopsis serialis TaxID=139415 RepID=UPI0020073A1C|nr:uncharacterized protein B0H18DRAFT_1107713 [Neoantrodia serialis]KAH9916171.1 hypothetical protein B0H18DRAFT_1107713 [Neoantrodia serialis]
MWRWCHRTVRDVGGFVRAAVARRASYPFHDLRPFLSFGREHRFSRSAGAASILAHSVSRGARSSRLIIPASPSELAATTLSAAAPGAFSLPRVHIKVSTQDIQAARTSPHADDRVHSLHQHADSTPAPLAPGRTRTHEASLHPSPLDNLRVLLATNITGSAAGRLSVTRVRSLYHSVRAQKLLGSLRPEEYSALIRLFGSLSLSALHRPYRSAYGHYLTGCMTDTSYRSHWVVVDRIARDKLGHEHPLNTSDHYWLMRMDIEALKTPEVEANSALLSAELTQVLKRVETHYARLRQYPSVDIHVPYLEAMFSSRVTLDVQVATKRLWELLVWYHGCPPRLLALVWQAVLGPPAVVQEDLKLAVLDAIWRRLLRSPSEQAVGSATQPNRFRAMSESGDRSGHLREPMNSVDLVPFLRDALFVRHTPRASAASKHEMSSWALSVARKVFAPDHLDENSVGHRWNCFLLLAVASSPGRTGGGSIMNGYARWGAVVDWQTICALASLQNAIRSKDHSLGVPFSDAVVQGLNRVLVALWEHWSSLPGLDHTVRPRVATRAICVSFMHLAGRLKNRDVVEACRQLCMTARLWEEGERGLSKSTSLRALVHEQLVALLLSGSGTEMAISATLESVQDEGLLTDVFNHVITIFAREDVMLALELRDILLRVGVRLSDDSVLELALRLAKQGDVPRAKEYLFDMSLSVDQRLKILNGILTQLVRRGHRFRSAHLTSDLVGAMLSHLSSSCPPAAMCSVLESTLLYMLRFQYSKAAVTIVEAVAQVDTAYFSPTFFGLFIRKLLRHRQFRYAKRMHELGHRLGVRDTPSSEWLTTQLSKHGASSLAKKVAKSSLATSGVSAVSRLVRFREARPSRVLVIKVPSFVRQRQVRDGPAVHRALELLVRAGRMRAVKQLYSQLCEDQSPSSRTAIGNSILHKSMQHPSRSQAHRGVRAVKTLNELVEHHGFVPDRVTINVLVKAYMQWTAGFTNEDLRALFDHFVRIGYPTGCAIYGVPFRTAEGPAPVHLPEVNSPLSYGKHVRPLYKMFIKAFYRRGDASAAKVVVKISKAAEAEAEDSLDAWRRSRVREDQKLESKLTAAKRISR